MYSSPSCGPSTATGDCWSPRRRNGSSFAAKFSSRCWDQSLPMVTYLVGTSLVIILFPVYNIFLVLESIAQEFIDNKMISLRNSEGMVPDDFLQVKSPHFWADDRCDVRRSTSGPWSLWPCLPSTPGLAAFNPTCQRLFNVLSWSQNIIKTEGEKLLKTDKHLCQSKDTNGDPAHLLSFEFTWK